MQSWAPRYVSREAGSLGQRAMDSVNSPGRWTANGSSPGWGLDDLDGAAQDDVDAERRGALVVEDLPSESMGAVRARRAIRWS